MARKRPITPLGWEIKKRLAELKMDQRQFCLKHNIPENRLSDIMTGARPAIPQRKRVVKILQINEEELDKEAVV